MHSIKSNLLRLLCAAVLVIAVVWTGPAPAYAQTSKTGSVGVEGKVPGDPPSRAPTITTPGNGQSFTTTPITVAGLCPQGELVKIFKNNVFAGSTQCINGSFSLQIDLFSGRNDLFARAADALDQDSPDSAIVTVTFDDARFGGAGTRIALTSNYVKRGTNPGETLTWPLILTGGTGPYAISVDWGDGKPNTLLSREFPGAFNVTHIYDSPGVYNIIIKATDKNGDAAFLQVVGVANGAISQSGTGAGNGSGNGDGTKTQVITKLPVPLFALVGTFAGFALLSFWLGSRFALLALRKRLQRGNNLYD